MDTVEQIKAWMNRRGYSQKQLAEKLGVSTTYLSYVFTGKRPLSSSLILKFEQISGENQTKYRLDEIVSFAVKITPEEYNLLCKKVGAEHLSMEECEMAVRDLLQRTFDELAEAAPKVVDLTDSELEAAEEAW